MRSNACPRDDPRMTTRRITLDLELGVEPITGFLECGDNLRHAFSGWLELASLLEGNTAVCGEERAEQQPAPDVA